MNFSFLFFHQYIFVFQARNRTYPSMQPNATFKQLLISVVSNDIKTVGYVRRFLVDSPTMGRADQA